MPNRRMVLIGTASALICAPVILRVGRLMPIRSFFLPKVQYFDGYYGFVDRLRIQSQFFRGELKGARLIEAREKGLLGPGISETIITHPLPEE